MRTRIGQLPEKEEPAWNAVGSCIYLCPSFGGLSRASVAYRRLPSASVGYRGWIERPRIHDQNRSCLKQKVTKVTKEKAGRKVVREARHRQSFRQSLR